MWNETTAYLALAAAGMFIGYLVERGIRRGRTRRAVLADLDSAYQNGYFKPDEQLHGCSPDEIAYDMTCYSPQFENAKPETLTPYVRQWLRQKGL